MDSILQTVVDLFDGTVIIDPISAIKEECKICEQQFIETWPDEKVGVACVGCPFKVYHSNKGGKKNPLKAIHEYCLECRDYIEGKPKERLNSCPNQNCPLWQHRMVGYEGGESYLREDPWKVEDLS